MNSSDKIINQLRQDNQKITKIRQAIINFVLKQKIPVSALTIQTDLFDGNINKTTIYRQLEFLKIQKIVQEIEFGDGKKRYEILKDHHHHLICTNCKKIEEIALENHLEQEEKRIQKLTNFKNIQHNLEFFGLCRQCQS